MTARSLPLLAALLPMLLASPLAGALAYSAKPIQATVVDAETNAPIADVIVVTEWALEHWNGSDAGSLQVTETVTDEHGAFQMPGWGPLEVRADESSRFNLRLGSDQPAILMFKPGYQFSVKAGPHESFYLDNPSWTGELVRDSYWNGKVLKLQRFKGTEAQYIHQLQANFSSLPVAQCNWTKNPRMVAAFFEQGDRFRYIDGYNAIRMLSAIKERMDGRYCGSPSQILGRFMPANHGQVLDQDTGQPIAGVIVVGNYPGIQGLVVAMGCERVESAVSDEQGWFDLPVDPEIGRPAIEGYHRNYWHGWPVRVPICGINNDPDQCQIWQERRDATDQVISIVKEPTIYHEKAEAAKAAREGQDLYLKRYKGPREERLRELLRLESATSCGTSKTSQGRLPFLEAILKEQIDLGDSPNMINATNMRLKNERYDLSRRK